MAKFKTIVDYAFVVKKKKRSAKETVSNHNGLYGDSGKARTVELVLATLTSSRHAIGYFRVVSSEYM